MSVSPYPESTPFAMCEQYATGRMSRSQLVEALVRLPSPATLGVESLLADQTSTFAQLAEANKRGTIDDTIYAEVFTARHLNAFKEEWPQLFDGLTLAQRQAVIHPLAARLRTEGQLRREYVHDLVEFARGRLTLEAFQGRERKHM